MFGLRRVPRLWSRVPSLLPRYLSTSPVSSSAPSTGLSVVFNREHKRIQRNLTAKLNETKNAEYLKDEVASRVVDRLLVLLPPFC